jgi:hypothetical protein
MRPVAEDQTGGHQDQKREKESFSLFLHGV